MAALRDSIGRLDSTGLVLVLANLVPLYGVFAWDWEVFPILFLFWFENIVIGILNAARMLTAWPEEPAPLAKRLFLTAFFCVHYGMFTAIHGVFVITLFGGMGDRLDGVLPGPDLVNQLILEQHLLIPVTALLVSHGYSYVVNFLARGEFRHATPKELMARPYRRVVLLHITILAGGGLVMMLDAPLLGLILLIALKAGLDLAAHLRSHAREQAVIEDYPARRRSITDSGPPGSPGGSS